MTQQESQPRLNALDIVRGMEKVNVLPTRFITISGRSGTGTTTTARLLEEEIPLKLGIKTERITVGDIKRDIVRERTGQELIGEAPDYISDQDIEEAIKRKMRKALKNPNPDTFYIIEGWTAGFAANQLYQELLQEDSNTPKAFRTYLLHGHVPITRPRAYERQHEIDRKLTKKAFNRGTIEREQTDRTRWTPLYPDSMRVRDPWGRRNLDKKGRPMFDVTICINSVSAERAAEVIMWDSLDLEIAGSKPSFETEKILYQAPAIPNSAHA